MVTDNSIFKYDGYTFHQYLHPDMMSSSLFNVKEDLEGAVYCNNLNGQIFKVADNSMQLVHAVPDSLLTPYIGFQFLPDNQLVIKSKAIYKVHEDDISIIVHSKAYNEYNTEMTSDNTGNLIMQYTRDSIYVISDDGYYSKYVSLPQIANKSGILTFNHSQQGVYVNDHGRRLLRPRYEDRDKMELEEVYRSPDAVGRIYLTSKDIWVANSSFGVRKIPFSDLSDPSERVFTNYYITYVFEDAKGNVLLGTKGDGLLVVPPVESVTIIKKNELKVSQIADNNDGGIFLGGYDGSVMEYQQGKFHTWNYTGSKLIEVLEYFPSQSLLFFNLEESFWKSKNNGRVFNMRLGSVKDIAQIDANLFLIATNSNSAIVNLSTDVVDHIKRGRAYAVAHYPQTGSNFLATASGLYLTTSEEEPEELFFNQSKVLSRDIEVYQGQVYVATKNHGVLKYEGQILEKLIDHTTGLLSTNVEQVQAKDQKIYVSSDQGFQIFDLNGELLKSLTLSDGMPSLVVQDFVVDDQFLWLLLPSGVQRISLASLFKKAEKASIQSIKIWVNDQLVSDKELQNLAYDENKLRFSIFAPSLDQQQDMAYRYRLKGIDKDYQIQPYHQNTIEYQSLPPGNYTLELNLMYTGEPQDYRSVELSISRPFWLSWWFALAIFLLIGLVFYVIFRIRLRAQEKRAMEINELNASKLTAIQSQMNPHFIFNAINSIQEYIMLNEKKLARKYLGKFADLMRIYLNHSRSSNITLREELDALGLYLELEKLRFENTLDYAIDLDDEVDADMISIPSFLIQPYVENALKHGLFHKSEDRKLLVEVHYAVYEQVLEVIIEDNGVGRKKSKEINMMRQKNHQSFATNATHRRLKLLNDRNNHQIGEQIIDLYNEDNEATGTRVQLTIPVVEHLV